LSKLFIIGQDSKLVAGLSSVLAQNGFTCAIATDGKDLIVQITAQNPDLILMAINNAPGFPGMVQQLKKEKQLPIIALVDQDKLATLNGHLEIDDFITQPHNTAEVLLRVRRLLHGAGNTNTGELIHCGELVVDPARCEVSLTGVPIVLTFKEYELLKFLASNRGRVFTREALLNKVWGYDYYGGDRTVDVHIRRLRSKIESSGHVFIETVRNIGYRFKAIT
jgi:DNA-binding response OmpR family regulator